MTDQGMPRVADAAVRPALLRRVPHGPVWLVTATLAALAAVLYTLVVARLHAGAEAPLLVPGMALAASFALAERTVVWVRAGRDQGVALSLTDIPLTVGLFLAGPLTLLAARLVGAASDIVTRGRISWHKDAFNLTCHGLSLGLAEVTWHLVIGDSHLLGPRAWLAAIAAVLVAETATALFIAAAIWADTGRRDSELRLGWGELVSGASACVGLLFVYVLSVDWRAGWLVLVVTVVLYVAHRSYAGLQRRTDDVESVSAFTGRLGRILDVDSVIGETLRTLAGDLRAGLAEVYVEDPAEPHQAVWQLDLRHGSEVRQVPLAESAIGRLDPSLDGPMVLARSLRTVRSVLARRAEVRDAVTVPVLREGVTVGTALVADRVDTARSFGRSDVAQLRALANHSATALHNARLTEHLRVALVQREHQAMHDELTGLANRRAFVERLERRSVEGVSCVVAIIDIDRFHQINDVLGSATGDVVLNLMAARLEQIYGADRVARLGSDDFVVLLDGAAGDIEDEMGRIRTRVQHKVSLGELDLSPDVSIGIAPMQPGEQASTTLAHADLALRRAKTARAGVAVYDPALDRATADRLTLLADLRQALADGALDVHFQPQVRLDDSTVVGFEALSRWRHPRRGPVPPDEFIEVAEQGGLMMQLTLFVLDEALRGLAHWRANATATGRDLGVSVNVSPRILMDPELLAQTQRLLTEHGIPADRLTLEITESDIMAESERAVAALAGFSDLGVRLSVDDLGTGYSSLAYLSRFPLDELKIDKSFVMQLVHDTATEAIVDTVVGLGRRLGRSVVAEGVEDVATWAQLRLLGCELAQGYLISRPLPSEEVLPWLQRWTGVRRLASVGGQLPVPVATDMHARSAASDPPVA